MANPITQPIPPSLRLSMPILFLRIEGFAVFATILMVYAHQGFSWLTFILLLFVPDLSIATYSINQRFGSIVYNLIHTYAFPLFLAVLGYLFNNTLGTQLALIWLAHIAMDRAAGFGLKYLGHFKNTHLSRV